MLKISKKMEYALIVLKFMAEHPQKELISARVLCDKFKIPFDTTAKVLQSLNQKQIVQSVKGTKGGYILEDDLSNLTYTQLIEIIDGESSNNFCITNKGLCHVHPTCNIITPVERLDQLLTQYLSQLTIQEILFGELKTAFWAKGECDIEDSSKSKGNLDHIKEENIHRRGFKITTGPEQLDHPQNKGQD